MKHRDLLYPTNVLVSSHATQFSSTQQRRRIRSTLSTLYDRTNLPWQIYFIPCQLWYLILFVTNKTCTTCTSTTCRARTTRERNYYSVHVIPYIHVFCANIKTDMASAKILCRAFFYEEICFSCVISTDKIKVKHPSNSRPQPHLAYLRKKNKSAIPATRTHQLDMQLGTFRRSRRNTHGSNPPCRKYLPCRCMNEHPVFWTYSCSLQRT